LIRAFSHAGKVRVRMVAAVFVAAGVLGVCLLLPACQEDDSRSNLEKIDALYQRGRRGFPNAPDLSVEELIERGKKEKVILVDKRKPEEKEVSMIRGAISAEAFERNIDGYRDAIVVVYCTIGVRSGSYTRELRERGIDAYNLKGGVLAWAHADGAFADDRGNPTRRVHVYGSKWSLLPEGYEPVW